MKRVLVSLVGTIMGLVALLSFKSHTQVVVASRLPSASLPSSSQPSSSQPSSSPSSASQSSSAAAAPPVAGSTTSSATPKPSASTPAAQAKTYAGQAVQTRYGTVQVQVTVANGKITDASFLQLTSNDGRSADINSQAGPLLLQETLSAQSANINTISGATFTSEGYLQSLQSALDQAAGK